MAQDVLTLRQPRVFEGAEVAEIAYDFDELTGEDMIQAEHMVGVAQTGDVKTLLMASPEYHAAVFARAAKQPIELIKAVGARDFAEISSRVTVFLMSD